MVDSSAISDMKDIMRAVGNAPPAMTDVATGLAEATALTGNPDANAMKVILERFQMAAEDLTEAAKTDVDLRESLYTSKTDSGTRIGSWEIIFKQVDGTRIFDLVNVATREPIATDLMLYEAAVSLARCLNDGISITDKRVRDIIVLEDEYVKNRIEAAHFKSHLKHMRSKGKDTRAAIAEDRFDEASRKAIEAQERIIMLAGIRR
jgi:hypothetical protein